MTFDSKILAEIVGTVAGIIANYSAFHQTVHCIKTKSAAGIAWGSLKTRCIAIVLFALSTLLYGGPMSMFIGNIFALANAVAVMTVKGKEDNLLAHTEKSYSITQKALQYIRRPEHS